MTDEIEIADYDPAWPDLFERERAQLARVLPPDQVLAIVHAGSTAIPGLAAKPIIDIFVAVPDIGAARATFVQPVTSLDYVYWAENPDPDALFFVKGMPPFGARRTHHIHVMEAGAPRWERVLVFRNHLRDHPAEAERYLALKRDLARRHRHDREAYTRAKDDYIAGLVRQARAIQEP